MVSFPEDSMSSSSSSSSSNYEKQSRQNNSPIEEDEQPPSSLSSSASSSDFTSDQYERNDGAFPLPDDMSVPKTRQLRWEREKLVLSKFANGDELFDLRHEVASLRKELAETRKLMDGASKKKGDDAVALRGLKRRVKEIEDKILRVSGRDAEFAYAVLLERVEKAESEGDKEKAKKIRKEAEEARACIPQLNMHGLWVGKYGENGYEMVNITYSGDTLVATKVTGDQNVPRGEISFTANLSPRAQFQTMSGLEPIELNARAARQWGKRYLPRHVGKGQVASEGYQNAQWMDGQLILVGRFFSFAWVPIGHQVFFGRPSAELTLKMLREHQEEEMMKDHVAVMREEATHMMDETYWSERENNYFEQEGCFE